MISIIIISYSLENFKCFFSSAESSNSSGPAIHNGRSNSLEMEEEGHRRSVPYKGQREEVVLLQDILPLPQGHDMGAGGLPPDRLQESQAVLTYLRS